MDVKDFLLAGGRLTAPYKGNVMDWFGDISIGIVDSAWDNSHTKKVFVQFPDKVESLPLIQFDSLLAEFIEHAFGKKNLAPVWRKVMKELKLDDVYKEDIPLITEALKRRGYLLDESTENNP